MKIVTEEMSLVNSLEIRTALLHDWLTGFRGGERVFEAFCELYPQAPIYTLLQVPGSTSETIESHSIYNSFLNAIPGIERTYRKFLPFFPVATRTLKIESDVQLVLSSCHCVIKGVKKPEGAVHVSYIHSPMRYMYDQYDQYFGPETPVFQRFGARLCRNYLIKWDRKSNENVDVMIANSAFVQARIKKFYGRDVQVVHPFVDLIDFRQVQKYPPARQDFYIMVTAFAPNKRVDLAIEAFNRIGRRLKIIGVGQVEKSLKKLAGPTIEFLGHQSRAEVIQHLATARALIFPGVEDFGITPLESIAAGTPVVAYRAGGVLETLTDEDTVFFEEQNVESLVDAVRRLEKSPPVPSKERANSFSRERFKNEMSEVISQALTKFRK